jgi:hypothetical protein
MSAASEDDNDPLKPWKSDKRLLDPFLLGDFSKVISAIQEFAALAERLPEGQNMSRADSIPKMWDMVKDLKPESINKLQASLQRLQESFKKDNEIASAGSKRSAEGEEIDETESPPTKTTRMGSPIENIMRLQNPGEEGICAIPPQCKCIVLSYCCSFRSSNALHMLYLHRCELVAHACCCCCGSKPLPRVNAQLI